MSADKAAADATDAAELDAAAFASGECGATDAATAKGAAAAPPATSTSALNFSLEKNPLAA